MSHYCYSCCILCAYIVPQSDAIDQYCQVAKELVMAEGGQAPEEQTSTPQQTYKEIVVTDEGGVRTILLNRPAKKNALNYQVFGQR